MSVAGLNFLEHFGLPDPKRCSTRHRHCHTTSHRELAVICSILGTVS